ncbi:MAG: PspC domain-containing protein [Candidatus Natronoplasma sp.]
MSKSLEDRIDDFGEELDVLGEKLEDDIEKFGKDIESRYQSIFGLAGPLLWSLVGLVFIGILVWTLYWMGETIPIPDFISMGDFILDHLALFFLLILLFNYISYFSKKSPDRAKYISPIFTALSITIWIWIITSLVLVLDTQFGLIRMMIFTIHENLLSIFIILMMISYLLVVIKEGKRSGSEDDKMAYDNSKWNEDEEMKRLYRSGKDKLLGGVCGGIGEYFEIDPVIVRIIWVILAFASLGTAILVYIILWILVPRNPEHNW